MVARHRGWLFWRYLGVSTPLVSRLDWVKSCDLRHRQPLPDHRRRSLFSKRQAGPITGFETVLRNGCAMPVVRVLWWNVLTVYWNVMICKPVFKSSVVSQEYGQITEKICGRLFCDDIFMKVLSLAISTEMIAYTDH